ncbi:MAG: hypothetical protein WCO25_02175 [Candidatus Uhrbacteria bacterium]
MRPKPSHVPPDSGSEYEARRAALLAEEEARRLRDLAAAERESAGVDPDGPIDERPFDITKELGGVDRRRKEFRVPRTPGTR